MTARLSDRYVQEVARGIPGDQRTDIVAELRATIADAVDGLVDNGLDPATAERDVLEDLGDPRILAAKYCDTPRFLIGPTFYPSYIAVLGTLLTVIPAIVGIVVAIASSVDGSNALSAVGDGVGSALQVAVYTFVWLTVIFAFVERKAGKAVAAKPKRWTLDKLPARSDRRFSRWDLILALGSILLLAGFFVWQRNNSGLLDENGTPVPLMHPGLWNDGWIVAIFATLVIFVAVEIAKYRVGHWTYRLAWVNALSDAAFVGVLAALSLSDRLINPEFIRTIDEQVDSPDITNLITWASINLWVLIAIFVVANTAMAFVRAREDEALYP